MRIRHVLTSAAAYLHPVHDHYHIRRLDEWRYLSATSIDLECFDVGPALDDTPLRQCCRRQSERTPLIDCLHCRERRPGWHRPEHRQRDRRSRPTLNAHGRETEFTQKMAGECFIGQNAAISGSLATAHCRLIGSKMYGGTLLPKGYIDVGLVIGIIGVWFCFQLLVHTEFYSAPSTRIILLI